MKDITGDKHPLFGKPGYWDGKTRTEHSKAMSGVAKSQEHKDNISKAVKGKAKAIMNCVFCGKDIAGPSNYYRWHGDNCKNNYLDRQ
jgi:hypothetical protein